MDIQWLLESDAYIAYASKIYLLGISKSDLSTLRKSVLEDPRIIGYLKDIEKFNETLVTSHKNAAIPIHKLHFLLDLGLDLEVPEIKAAADVIIKNKGKNGMYKSMTNVPVHFGGNGVDSLAWALCDAPLMLYALLRLGLPYDEYIKEGVDYILKLQRDNGLPCTVSGELGKFRGPGRKDDCCPYATLISLKLLSLIPEYINSEVADSLVKVLLDLWERSQEQHPYMFYMGKDFRKLKTPILWYDIVSMVDCLSHFEVARNDKRFKEMLQIILDKADNTKRFTPESIYLKCKEWDFGQKKKPSPWLTFVIYQILLRTNTQWEGN